MVEQGVWAGDERQPRGWVHLSGAAVESSEQRNEKDPGTETMGDDACAQDQRGHGGRPEEARVLNPWRTQIISRV